MNDRRDRILRYAVILGVVGLVAGGDLWSKRWAEVNLATERHLLPITAPSTADGMTVGDVVRTRFPGLTDEDLRDSILRLPRKVELDPSDAAYELQAKRGIEATGFFVFDKGDLSGFARRLDRNEQTAIERLVMRVRPDLGFTEARKQVREYLGGVTLAKYLGQRLKGLNEEEIAATVRGGLFPIPANAEVAASEPAKAGETYLLGERQVVMIPGHFDFSYAENPHGAWGILSDVDENVKRGVFFVLSILAILAISYLLVRPPTTEWLPVLALGGILGGAIGNLVDRLTLTYVVDFIHMYWDMQWQWPRYNVADIGITVGVIVLLLVTGFKKEAPAKGR